MQRLSNNTALNKLVIASGSDVLGEVLKKTITLTGGTGEKTVATVTGLVEVQIIPLCTANVTSGSGATIQLGTVTSGSGGFLTNTVATAITANKIWNGTSGSAVLATTSVAKYLVGENIILTVGSGTITAGTIDFYIRYHLISDNGNIV